MMLRRLKWESGWLYALGGICGGLVINAVVQGEVWDRWSPGIVAVDLQSADVGALAALTFWCAARERSSHDD